MSKDKRKFKTRKDFVDWYRDKLVKLVARRTEEKFQELGVDIKSHHLSSDTYCFTIDDDACIEVNIEVHYYNIDRMSEAFDW